MKCKENWEDVVNHEGWYEISDWGNVKRVNGDNSARAGKILKPIASHGYRRVSMYKDGARTSSHIHQMVMAAFVGPCPNDSEVNHKDGVKTNNHLDNLEYVTHRENMLHAFSKGLLTRQGEKNSQSKLTEDNVHETRRLLKAGMRQADIARIFNVSRSTIYSIAHGKSWASLKEEDDE